ncbi:MAG: gliding motility-associated C-terminal domain-containing protein [Ignavibacteria bacterium]|nr:gliding motility-associated C-terminal domain-containing protein [Ignavibacteria bacterium]
MEANQLVPGNHQVIIKDDYGCEISKSFNIAFNAITIKPDINNVFTPNGDGQNDTWVIKNLDVFRENQLFIYNRWGNEVYTTKNYANNWNGSDLAEGTYFYILKVKICEDWYEFNGYVTILR